MDRGTKLEISAIFTSVGGKLGIEFDIKHAYFTLKLLFLAGITVRQLVFTKILKVLRILSEFQ